MEFHQDDLLKVKDKISEASYKELLQIHCKNPPTDNDIAESKFVIIYCDVMYSYMEDDLTDVNGFNLFSTINEMRNKRYLLMVVDDVVNPIHVNQHLNCVNSFSTGNCISISRMELKILKESILNKNGYVTNDDGEIYRINYLEILCEESMKSQPWRSVPYTTSLRKRKREEAKHRVSDELYEIKEEITDITYIRLMNLLAGKAKEVPRNLENCQRVELCGDEITQQMNSDSGEIFLNVKCDCKRILKVVKKDEFEFCWNFFSNQQIDEIESGYLNYILLKMRRGQSVKTLSVDNLNTNDRDLYRITDVRVID